MSTGLVAHDNKHVHAWGMARASFSTCGVLQCALCQAWLGGARARARCTEATYLNSFCTRPYRRGWRGGGVPFSHPSLGVSFYYRAEASPGWVSWAIISIAMAACFVLFENEPAFGMMTRRGCAAHAACSRKSRLKTDHLRGVFRYAEGESFAPVSCGQ